ncbi:hypothetical protein H4582DRAFT_2062417 [Lactarius indigo]|nr:hypothetical protein H4582DRAFT_2062417 [Lactarius indigo]
MVDGVAPDDPTPDQFFLHWNTCLSSEMLLRNALPQHTQLCLIEQVVDVDATPRRALTEPTPPQAAIQTSGNTPKCPRDPMSEQTEHPPAKQAKVEGGPSHLQVTGHPQQVAGGDDLLVLPPIPKDIYDELISSYEFIASSYNDFNSLATEPKMSEDKQEKRRVTLKQREAAMREVVHGARKTN